MPSSDFDMVAEHRIVPDLQRRDSGGFPIAALQSGNPVRHLSDSNNPAARGCRSGERAFCRDSKRTPGGRCQPRGGGYLGARFNARAPELWLQRLLGLLALVLGVSYVT